MSQQEAGVVPIVLKMHLGAGVSEIPVARCLFLHPPGDFPREAGLCRGKHLDDVHALILRLIRAVAHLKGMHLSACHCYHVTRSIQIVEATLKSY